MELKTLGIAFPHHKGAFCPRTAGPNYTLCCFETPFLYERNGQMFSGAAGDLLIMEPGVPVYHGPTRDAATGFVNDWLRISGDDFGQLLQQYPLPLNQAFSVGKSHALRSYAQRASAEFYSQSPGRNELIQCILTEAIICLHRAYLQNQEPISPGESMTSVRNAIAQHPGKPWTLKRLSEISGYSVSRFCELYRARYGIPPMEDVLQLRLELAKQLLSSGQATVSYVAETCGFRTVNYFSKYFRQRVGCTPSQYIQAAITEENTYFSI